MSFPLTSLVERYARKCARLPDCVGDPRLLRIAAGWGARRRAGFDLSQGSPVGHWGLIGMRERAASIGARLTVISAPGGGTEVVLVLAERSGWSALRSRVVRALYHFRGM